MSDALLIALLALIGSALGGLVSPVALRLLERKFARDDSVEVQQRADRVAMSAALQELFREAYAADLARYSYPDATHVSEVNEAYQRLVQRVGEVELLLKPQDEEISTLLWAVLRNVTAEATDDRDRVRLLRGLVQGLAAWNRGSEKGLTSLRELAERDTHTDTP